MKKLIIALLFLSSYAVAQNTATISGTIKDSSGTTWNYATWQANLVGTVNPVFQDGTPVTATVHGTLSSGVISGTLARTDKIADTNTSWTFIVCPFVSSPCQTVTGLKITTSTLDVSTYINARLAAPSILSTSTPLTAFDTSEISNQQAAPYNGSQPNAGQLYYNPVTDKYQYWSTATQSWKDVGGTSGGCVTDCVVTDPTGNQIINQPASTQFSVGIGSGSQVNLQMTQNGLFIFDNGTSYLDSSFGESDCLACFHFYGGGGSGDAVQLWGWLRSGNAATREFTSINDDELNLAAGYFLYNNCYQGSSLECDPADPNQLGPSYSFNASTGNKTITLPSACPGYYNTGGGGDGLNCGPLGSTGNLASLKYLYKVDSSSNTITIVPNSGETIVGYPSGYVLSQQNQGVTLMSNGNTLWYVIGVTNPPSLNTTGSKAICLADGTNCPASAVIKTVSVSPGCTTGANSYDVCSNTLTWSTPFADSNYTVTCQGENENDPRAQIADVTTKLAGSFVVRTVTEGSNPVDFGTISCMGVHN